MLGAMFLFTGRLKRLPYFLIGFALFCVLVTVIGAMIAAVAPQLSTLENNPEAIKALLPMLPVAMLVIAVNTWISLSTQACRVRDIGWNPVIVIPLWLLAVGMGNALSVSVHGLSPIVALGNLAFGCCVLFWPSKPETTGFGGDFMVDPEPAAPAPRYASAMPASPAPRFTPPSPTPGFAPQPAPVASAPMPAFVARAPASQPSFGRRGVR